MAKKFVEAAGRNLVTLESTDVAALVIPVDEKGNIGVSSSGGAGGGSIVYTNASGDFVATPTTGAKTITLTGLPFTVDVLNVISGSIKKVGSDGVVTNIPLSNVGVAGGVITLPEADNFVSGDQVVVTLIGPDKAYDESLDVIKTSNQNPDYGHYTSAEALVDVTNAAANKYFAEIIMESFREMYLQIIATDSTAVTIKVYATIDPIAVCPDTGGTPGTSWVEITSDIFGGALSAASISQFKKVSGSPLKYLFEYTVGTATNDIYVLVKKYY